MEKLFGMTVDNLTSYCESFLEYLAKNPAFVKFMKKPCASYYESWTCTDIPDCVGTASGASKAVIFTDMDDFVIKVPFLWRTDKLAMMKDEFRLIEQFDYCRAEARNYQVVLREGMSMYFAPSYKLFDFEIDGVVTPIYVMAKMDCDESRVSVESFDDLCEVFRSTANYGSEEELEDMVTDYFCEVDEAYLEWLQRLAGEEADALLTFCADNYINDVHSANIGFDLDGNPRIIDYSGFSIIEKVDLKEDWYCVN